ALVFFSSAANAQTEKLQDDWQIQDSAKVSADGSSISQATFDAHTWLPATVPSTVLGNLVPPTTGDGSESDPFFGTNLFKLPGTGPYYTVKTNFGDVVTPPESPFGRAWWYRTNFTVDALKSGQ